MTQLQLCSRQKHICEFRQLYRNVTGECHQGSCYLPAGQDWWLFIVNGTLATTSGHTTHMKQSCELVILKRRNPHREEIRVSGCERKHGSHTGRWPCALAIVVADFSLTRTICCSYALVLCQDSTQHSVSTTETDVWCMEHHQAMRVGWMRANSSWLNSPTPSDTGGVGGELTSYRRLFWYAGVSKP